MPRSERQSVRAVPPLTAAALSLPLGVGSAAAAPRPPSPGAHTHAHTHTHTHRGAPGPRPRAEGREAAMSLLSRALPALRLYCIGLAVALHQLLRRLRPGGAPAPVFPTQNGNVAIVTGGAKGIGYHTVKHLARLGMHVIIAGNDESEGQEAVRKIKEETVNEKGVHVIPKRKRGWSDVWRPQHLKERWRKDRAPEDTELPLVWCMFTQPQLWLGL
ncbi:dehydrogenase/reductase SDR family member on chromosome X [Dermochelys coriacea]|uniref:dehydrogenase/reductase SDR family member on chromosome X n=1 Tax=Dermochelys coriacea TaxID=27794 RepID=UPI001CA7FCAE|nr:dehydrogenase/reductase SDR family member on chromosome X [Dermochelys coriacea]